LHVQNRENDEKCENKISSLGTEENSIRIAPSTASDELENDSIELLIEETYQSLLMSSSEGDVGEKNDSNI